MMTSGTRHTNPRWTDRLAIARRQRFSILLAALILVLLSAPIARVLAPAVSPPVARAGVAVVFTVMLIAAAFAVGRTRRTVVMALALVIPAVLFREIRLVSDAPWLQIIEHLFSMAFLGLTIVLILAQVFASRRVTFNTIAGALCVYLLIGTCWAIGYSLLEVVEPGSFSINTLADADAAMRYGDEYSLYSTYFSLVTLTTLGYGDITPLTPAARMSTAVEAIVGQLYLAVLVARLVGLHIAQAQADSPTDRDGLR